MNMNATTELTFEARETGARIDYKAGQEVGLDDFYRHKRGLTTITDALRSGLLHPSAFEGIPTDFNAYEVWGRLMTQGISTAAWAGIKLGPEYSQGRPRKAKVNHQRLNERRKRLGKSGGSPKKFG